MAKMFYSTEEAAERLGKSADAVADLVRAGKLREFRDAGSVHYKVEDVDALASDGPSAESTGDIVLEPA
ncbi:MAG: helix-turn-helix domain-containing protein, partial [Phycisphaerae bacterium]